MTTEEKTLKTLQRVIFPSAVETDVVPLYVDAGAATGVQLPTRFDSDAATSLKEATDAQTLNAPAPAASANAARNLTGRRSITVGDGKHPLLSGRIFNAFPASYWRRWTVPETGGFERTYQW